MYKWKRERRF